MLKNYWKKGAKQKRRVIITAIILIIALIERYDGLRLLEIWRFRNIIDNGIKFLYRINQNVKLYKELRKFVGILLNPLSHADVGVERYKVEL